MLLVLSLPVLHDEVGDLPADLLTGLGLAVVLFEVHADDVLLVHGDLAGHDPAEVLVLAVLLVAPAVALIVPAVVRGGGLESPEQLLHY